MDFNKIRLGILNKYNICKKNMKNKTNVSRKKLE